MGVDEREKHGSTVYNTLLYFDADGRLLGKHRKLMPTHAERLVWGMGDGSDLEVHQTAVGRVGGLICWENFMPLARFAVYAQGIDVIGTAPAARFSDLPDSVPERDRLWRAVEPHGDWMLDGYSVIVDPAGTVLAGPLVREEGILYAELDLAAARARSSPLPPESVDEAVDVGDGDGERRMPLAAVWRRYRRPEVDTHAGVPVGPEGQAAVDERASRARGRPPPVVAGDVGLVDVGERRLHPQEPERRPEGAVVGERDPVLPRPEPERQPERGEPHVHGVGEEFGHT